MAIRDMDIAAEIIGVNPLKAKLTAFAVSSFYVGMCWRAAFSSISARSKSARSLAFRKSFLDSVYDHYWRSWVDLWSFAGAAFLVLLPVVLKNVWWSAWLGHGSCAHFELSSWGA